MINTFRLKKICTKLKDIPAGFTLFCKTSPNSFIFFPAKKINKKWLTFFFQHFSCMIVTVCPKSSELNPNPNVFIFMRVSDPECIMKKKKINKIGAHQQLHRNARVENLLTFMRYGADDQKKKKRTQRPLKLKRRRASRRAPSRPDFQKGMLATHSRIQQSHSLLSHKDVVKNRKGVFFSSFLLLLSLWRAHLTYSADFQKCPGCERRRLRLGSFSSSSTSLEKLGRSSCSKAQHSSKMS